MLESYGLTSGANIATPGVTLNGNQTASQCLQQFDGSVLRYKAAHLLYIQHESLKHIEGILVEVVVLRSA